MPYEYSGFTPIAKEKNLYYGIDNENLSLKVYDDHNSRSIALLTLPHNYIDISIITNDVSQYINTHRLPANLHEILVHEVIKLSRLGIINQQVENNPASHGFVDLAFRQQLPNDRTEHIKPIHDLKFLLYYAKETGLPNADGVIEFAEFEQDKDSSGWGMWFANNQGKKIWIGLLTKKAALEMVKPTSPYTVANHLDLLIRLAFITPAQRNDLEQLIFTPESSPPTSLPNEYLKVLARYFNLSSDTVQTMLAQLANNSQLSTEPLQSWYIQDEQGKLYSLYGNNQDQPLFSLDMLDSLSFAPNADLTFLTNYLGYLINQGIITRDNLLFSLNQAKDRVYNSYTQIKPAGEGNSRKQFLIQNFQNLISSI